MSEAVGLSRAASLGLFTLKAVGLIMLVYAAVAFVAQRRLLFPGATREPERTTAEAPAGVDQIWLEPSFGRVEAWYFEAPPSGPAVVFAHGNAELIDDWRGGMERLRDAGVGALMVEFPGYGFSEGSPSRAAIRETFAEAYDWLVENGGVDPSRIVAYGRSLGGGAAADLSLDRPVRALVLQSTFTSTAALARSMLLPGFLVRDRFDNQRAVGAFEGPVLVMHGVQDDVIPYSHAESLARAREGLTVTTIDCAHNDCLSVWIEIVADLTGFLAENGLMRDAAGTRGSG